MRITLLHIRENRTEHPGYQAVVDALTSNAVRAVEELGWEATLLPVAQLPLQEVLDSAADADAVIVLGGEDVHPDFYGGPLEYHGSGNHELDADRAQLAVIHAAAESGKPLLGICRGNQLINVAFGGTLIQDLPHTYRHRGRGISIDAFVPGQVTVEEEFVADVLGDSPTLCAHHQAIDKIGDSLRVVARAEDGIIEAVVHESAPITGVQWHPEHPNADVSQLQKLLRRLESQHLARGTALETLAV
jgi:putative glutamine amidotransferase